MKWVAEAMWLLLLLVVVVVVVAATRCGAARSRV